MRLSVCGLHLAGVGTKKSALVRGSVTLNVEEKTDFKNPRNEATAADVYAGGPKASTRGRENDVPGASSNQFQPPLIWEAYTHEAGASKNLSSEEKIVRALKDLAEPNLIVIDSPLTLPPCMTCNKPCPGVSHCDVEEVTFMKEIIGTAKKSQVKPYLDRAYEYSVRAQLNKSALQAEPNETSPVLGSNRAPMTARGVQMLNILAQEFPQSWILETNSVLSARGWAKAVNLRIPVGTHFKHGMDSRLLRIKLLKNLEQKQIAVRSPTLHLDIFKEFYNMNEVFSAAMSTLTGWGFLVGRTFVDKELVKQVASPQEYKQLIYPPQLPRELFET